MDHISNVCYYYCLYVMDMYKSGKYIIDILFYIHYTEAYVVLSDIEHTGTIHHLHIELDIGTSFQYCNSSYYIFKVMPS